MNDNLITEASWNDLVNEAEEWESRQYVLSRYKSEVEDLAESLRQDRIREEEL